MGDIARAGVTGTSEYAAEERQGPFSPAGLLIMLLVGFIAGYVVGTLKRAGDRSSGAMNKPGE